MFRLRYLVTLNFVVQLLNLLWVKQQYFFSSSSRSKENTENFFKVPHQCRSWILRVLTPFSRKQRENKTCAVWKYVYHSTDTYTLRKNWEDMWDFADFVKSGWSDLNGDLVYYKCHDHPKWKGPATVLDKDGQQVLIKHGGYCICVYPCSLTSVEKKCVSRSKEPTRYHRKVLCLINNRTKTFCSIFKNISVWHRRGKILDFDISFLNNRQILTELQELEDQSAVSHETSELFHFGCYMGVQVCI